VAINVPIVSDWNDRGLKNAGRDIDSFSAKAKRQFGDLNRLGKRLAIGFSAAAAGAVAFGKSAVTAASDFDESVNKLSVIIGDASDQVVQFAKDAATIGISSNAALESAGKFAIFGKAAGLAGDDLATFSTDFVKLSADMASFNNANPEDVMEAIGAALRGQSVPLQRYGVLLNDAAMRAAALELGIYNGIGALTAEQKILAAQKLIYEQTGDAQGDFARTSDGLANQQRILAARLQNLRTEIGLKLLPVMTRFAGLITNRLYPAVERFTRFAWRRLVDAFQTARPFLDRIVTLFNDNIRPAIERLIKFMQDNEDAVKAFFGVLAGAAVLIALGSLVTVLSALFTPIGLLVGAMGVLAGAFVYAYQNVELFRDLVDKVGQFIRDKFPVYFRQAVDAIVQAWEWAWPYMLSFARWFQRTWLDEDSRWRAYLLEGWREWTTALGALISHVFRTMVDIVRAFWQGVKGLFDFWIGLLTGDWGRMWQGLKDVATASMRLIIGAIKLLISPFIVLWSLFGEDIKRLWNTAFDFVVDKIRRAADIILTIVRTVRDAIASIPSIPTPFGNLPVPTPLGIIGGIRNILPFAEGGLVTRPTLGLIGEAGPELVVPLDRLDGMNGQTVIVNVAGSVVSERDLIEQIRIGLIRAQRSGKPLVA